MDRYQVKASTVGVGVGVRGYGSIPGRVIPKTLTIVEMASLLCQCCGDSITSDVLDDELHNDVQVYYTRNILIQLKYR